MTFDAGEWVIQKINASVLVARKFMNTTTAAGKDIHARSLSEQKEQKESIMHLNVQRKNNSQLTKR